MVTAWTGLPATNETRRYQHLSAETNLGYLALVMLVAHAVLASLHMWRYSRRQFLFHMVLATAAFLRTVHFALVFSGRPGMPASVLATWTITMAIAQWIARWATTITADKRLRRFARALIWALVACQLVSAAAAAAAFAFWMQRVFIRSLFEAGHIGLAACDGMLLLLLLVWAVPLAWYERRAAAIAGPVTEANQYRRMHLYPLAMAFVFTLLQLTADIAMYFLLPIVTYTAQLAIFALALLPFH